MEIGTRAKFDQFDGMLSKSKVCYNKTRCNLSIFPQRCVQVLMDHSVALLYRPKILKRLAEGPSAELCNEQDDPNAVDTSDELVAAMNNVIEIVTLCAKCLLRFSPNLMKLLCDVDFFPGQWYPLIEIQFGVPKMNSDNYSQLSFGTVLRAVCIFTKVLNVVS